MNEAYIVVDLSTLELSENRITSTIYLQVGQDQNAFPEKEWNDNTAIILSWWLDNLLNGRGEFCFMEGPFFFKENKSRLVSVACGKEQTSYSIDWQTLRESIVKAAEQVIAYLNSKGCTHQDLTELKNKYALRRNWSA